MCVLFENLYRVICVSCSQTSFMDENVNSWQYSTRFMFSFVFIIFSGTDIVDMSNSTSKSAEDRLKLYKDTRANTKAALFSSEVPVIEIICLVKILAHQIPIKIKSHTLGPLKLHHEIRFGRYIKDST